ncbi:AAA family ATPase [Ammonifex thiophilus]|uniref:CobQ/CobB/MinD/ParA nucleotide binding domain-containing protein n=1 Tax=Ammonifex thiophilus TaxID=444093 RepID=A0A3D8P4L3_9THEO|nr:MinD/ParA family protein [Ammonifex thiophilus]RDV82352.1 hypothetical protein DXX99_08035 [Ammonifex thiophilus]
MGARNGNPKLFLAGPPDFVAGAKREADRQGAVVVGEASTPHDLFALVDRSGADAVVLPTGPEWVKAAADLARVRPNLRVFASGPLTRESWELLSGAGARSVSGDPARAVQAAVNVLKRLYPYRFVFSPPGGGEGPAAPAGDRRVVAVPSRLVAVYSSKGGVGKTTVASNLAACLGAWARRQEEGGGPPCRVALLDFNADGSTAVYTFCRGAVRPKSVTLWRDLGGGQAPVSWPDVEVSMNYHGLSNVYYLAPPLLPEEVREFDAELAARVLRLAARFFHFVVVDMGVAVSARDPAVLALEQATDVLLVVESDPDVAMLVGEKWRRETRLLVGDEKKVRLVFNKVRKTWYSLRDLQVLFERMAGQNLPVAAELPEDPALEKSKAKGAPLYSLDPSSPFCRALDDLARRAFGILPAPEAEKKRGWLSRLFGRRVVEACPTSTPAR